MNHPLPVTQESPRAVHPRGAKARVLLCSVFGPYAQDDAFGSRSLNPMELYHNQVTRVQGPFSLRMFHRSWGLMLIQANIAAPSTILDFPTLDRFIQEIRENDYDVIGITAIIPNMGKVRHMCQLIREHLPNASIVVGGHLANVPTLGEQIDADHIVRGEGVRWFQHYLGQREDQPIRHPRILSGLGTRTMGIPMPSNARHTAATLIPSVGCPMGCNFCSTSAMFGGKGRHIDFYKTGEELFEVMVGLEKDLGVNSFFVMDENFLLHRKRALRLLELMEEHGKAWALYVFSSANVLRSYTLDQLIRLGISWVWMGIEGKDSKYAKLKRADTLDLVRTLQDNGVRVLGSTIIGMEEHTPENLDAAIDHAVEHDTEFHQFMLYTPLAGTPLYHEMKEQGRLLDPEFRDAADTHGQKGFNYRHPHIPASTEGDWLVKAFTRDFEVNGPSVLRVVRTTLAGWRKHRHHPDPRVRQRFRNEATGLASTQAAAAWATRAWYADNPALRERADTLLKDLYRTFGLRTRLIAPLLGRYILGKLRAEDARLKAGWTYEPPTFYEKSAGVPMSVTPTTAGGDVPRRAGAYA